MSGPLSGVKVLELATMVAAPSCARILSDMGAEVIKIEHPKGDGWRRTAVNYHADRFSEDESPVFDIYNSGKKHIAINLKTEKGMEAFHKLLAQSDVFITNTRPAALKRLGIYYDDLKERYPGLIYAIILGYGEKGPDKDMPAFDTTAFWSKSGFLRDLSPANENYAPVNPPSSVGDTACGYLLMGQICAALYSRKETGKGDFVRSGLYHNAVFMMGTMQIITQRPFGTKYPRSRADSGAPGGAFECADGEWIFIAMGGDPVIQQKIRKMMDTDPYDDPRFATPELRRQNRREWYEFFRQAFLKKTTAQWRALGQEVDIPITVMGHFADISEDEQAWANDYLERVTFRSGNTLVMPRSPVEMDSVGLLDTKCAPYVGADTVEVLQSLGYSEEEITEMRTSGAVATEKQTV